MNSNNGMAPEPRGFVDRVRVVQLFSHLSGERDVSNDTCFNEMSDEELDFLLEQYTETPALYYDLFIVAPFPLAILGTVLNILFIYHSIKGVRAGLLPKRLYLFLINRSIGDGLAAFTTALISIYGFFCGPEIPNTGVLSFSDTVFWITYWAAVVSYSGLCVMKLLAVARPLLYARLVTTKHCVFLISVSWVMALIAGGFVMMAMISLAEDDGWCRYENCGMFLVQGCAIFEFICYVAVLACFAATFAYIRKAENSRVRNSTISACVRKLSYKPSSVTLKKKSRMPNNWRLGVDVVAFGVMCFMPCTVGVFVAFVFNECYFTKHWYIALVLSGVMRIVILLRVCVDPVIDYITDPKLRGLCLLCRKVEKRIASHYSNASIRSMVSTTSMDTE